MKRLYIYFILLIFIIGLIYSIYLITIDEKEITPRSFSSHFSYETIETNLDVPWEIVFLPNEDMLVTERAGTLLRIGNNKEIIKIEGVQPTGEGGLLGMTLHPNFDKNHFIYLYFTSLINGRTENRVERYFLDLKKDILINKKVILGGIPGASYHDGGRISFGPDGYLYITTGDAGNPNNAQDIDSLAGKILRVDEEGNIPSDNPFGNQVYSYGHRNPQGLTWDEEGNLWATEHGNSPPSEFDELNLIKKGNNYGWPLIQGDTSKEGMVKPIIHSGGNGIWAPADAAYYKGRIFFVGLRGESLYEYVIDSNELRVHYKNTFGRLRAIALKDNYLYISTSNKDNRGNHYEGDDKIIKISLDDFN